MVSFINFDLFVILVGDFEEDRRNKNGENELNFFDYFLNNLSLLFFDEVVMYIVFKFDCILMDVYVDEFYNLDFIFINILVF